MNKIKIVNDDLKLTNINKSITLEYYKKECLFQINEFRLNINKSSDLQIEIDLNKESKLNFNIDIKPDVIFNLTIITKGKLGKIQYKYNLENNSICNVFKFQNVDSIREMISANLNGENADFEYNFKTISNDKETYDYYVYHNGRNTISNVKNNGVAINDGKIIYQVSTFVPRDIKGCIANQSNRIINLTNNKCEIMPNLYIDCNDVEASHSALIGKFSDEEMFYIQSRGFDYNSALKLLINGFLTSGVKDKNILKIIFKEIDKYWR